MATEAQILALIDKYAPLHQKYAKKYGAKICSPAIAQMLQESLGKYPNGLSGLAYNYHNFHGLKCGSYWLQQGKPSICLETGEEYKVGTISQITDFFRVFPNDEAGIEGYYQFLEMKRYQNLKQCTTPQQYLNTVKADGYCTSSTYISNCMSKVNKYNLTRFDDFDYVEAQPSTIKSTPSYKVGVTYETTVDLFVRVEPKGEKKLYSELSANAKTHAFAQEGYGILKKGTKVTCKAIKVVGNQTWGMIPSGWVCFINNGKIYVK